MKEKTNNNQLPNQFTVRIYNPNDHKVLQDCYDLSKTGFKDQAEFIRYCLVLGAEKLMGDNKVDQRLNLDEIKNILKDMNENLKDIKGEMQVNEFERKIDFNLLERYINYIACVCFYNEGNKDINNSLDNVLFSTLKTKMQIRKELTPSAKREN